VNAVPCIVHLARAPVRMGELFKGSTWPGLPRPTKQLRKLIHACDLPLNRPPVAVQMVTTRSGHRTDSDAPPQSATSGMVHVTPVPVSHLAAAAA
jgi:hypothetical protein